MVDSIIINGFGLGGTQHTLKLSLDESIQCPFCHREIETQPMCFLYTKDKFAEIFFKCKKCVASFIGYSSRSADGCYRIYKFSKGNHKLTNFAKEIKDVSENFVKIYLESEFAEQENLLEICGVGYRKALEYLIKDYLIKKDSDKEEEIKSKFLGNCISEMINNQKIKEIAKRATWIGNDETHYVKKWEDKDLVDLKKLINITVHFISMEIESDKYIDEMVSCESETTSERNKF
ncbi:MAG: DUF4145 domain-containing protein [Nanoarchaeota archaeon]